MSISKKEAEFIRSLADEDGYIEPKDVVARARDPKSPIHKHFPWDVRKAAEERWMDIARRLIRFVKMEYEIEHVIYKSVAYVSDPDRPKNSRRYQDVTILASNRTKARKIITAELERITAGIRRALELAMFLGLREVLNDFLADAVRIHAMAQGATGPTPGRRAKKRSRKPRRQSISKMAA